VRDFRVASTLLFTPPSPMKKRAAWLARRGRPVVRNCWLLSARRALLFAAVCMTLWLCVRRAFGRAPRRALREPPRDAAFKCVVLTLNASARVDPRCTRFVGTRFHEEEFVRGGTAEAAEAGAAGARERALEQRECEHLHEPHTRVEPGQRVGGRRARARARRRCPRASGGRLGCCSSCCARTT
jgi:hypothetical protein